MTWNPDEDDFIYDDCDDLCTNSDDDDCYSYQSLSKITIKEKTNFKERQEYLTKISNDNNETITDADVEKLNFTERQKYLTKISYCKDETVADTVQIEKDIGHLINKSTERHICKLQSRNRHTVSDFIQIAGLPDGIGLRDSHFKFEWKKMSEDVEQSQNTELTTEKLGTSDKINVTTPNASVQNSNNDSVESSLVKEIQSIIINKEEPTEPPKTAKDNKKLSERTAKTGDQKNKKDKKKDGKKEVVPLKGGKKKGGRSKWSTLEIGEPESLNIGIQGLPSCSSQQLFLSKIRFH